MNRFVSLSLSSSSILHRCSPGTTQPPHILHRISTTFDDVIVRAHNIIINNNQDLMLSHNKCRSFDIDSVGGVKETMVLSFREEICRNFFDLTSRHFDVSIAAKHYLRWPTKQEELRWAQMLITQAILALLWEQKSHFAVCKSIFNLSLSYLRNGHIVVVLVECKPSKQVKYLWWSNDHSTHCNADVDTRRTHIRCL